MHMNISPALFVCLAVISISTLVDCLSPFELFKEFGKMTSRKLWNYDEITSKVSFLLLKPNWKPKGVTYDEVIDQFPGNTSEAFDILWNDPHYEYHERPFSRSHELFTLKDESGAPQYNPQLESILIVHPMWSNASDAIVKTTITALGMRNLQKKYNIFAVNLKDTANGFYIIVQSLLLRNPNFDLLATVSVSLIVKGVALGHMRPAQVHIIGHSLSSTLAGYMARTVDALFGQKLASILALDPFNFDRNKNVIMASRDDAEVVHSVHTNSPIAGTIKRLASADFVFNGGKLLPECNKWRKRGRLIAATECSHKHVVQRMWYAILFPRMFQARRCAEYPRFQQCLCEDNPTVFFTFPLDKSASGTYQLTSQEHRPYGLGEVGASCEARARQAVEQQHQRDVRSLEKLWNIQIHRLDQ